MTVPLEHVAVICQGLAQAKKIFCAGYFWPSMFKVCITAIQKCHNFQIYHHKMHAPPAPLHPITVVDPFAKWGIYLIRCNPHLLRGMDILF